MTNFEAIIGSLYPYAVDEALILKTCIDLDIIDNDEYTIQDREKIARATIGILLNLITLSSESKGGNSLSYNADNIKERIYNIASFNGFNDIAEQYKVGSRITDKTDMW